MMKVAVVLSGCGHQDGAEIRESVITLLALSRGGASVQIFAPDIEQPSVVNHLTNQPVNETRNVMLESARIARGAIKPLSNLKADDFHAIVIPGGFGVAKNLSTFANDGANAKVNPDFTRVLEEFAAAKKPIGAICIAPVIVALVLGRKYSPTLTIGDDAGVAAAIEACGAKHQNCATDNIIFDEPNLIVTCSAYMRDDELKLIADGIEKLVSKVLSLCK